MDLLTKQVQGALLSLHYDLDPARDDGLWGPKTRQAMQAYEVAMHLPVTDTLADTVLSKSIPALPILARRLALSLRRRRTNELNVPSASNRIAQA